MKKISFSGPSEVTDEKTNQSITDRKKLKSLDGLVYDRDDDNCFSYWLVDHHEPSIKDIGISGGYLKFIYVEKNNELWVQTEYDLERDLTQSEITHLRAYTLAQWWDGIGSNFSQEYAEETGIFINPIRDDKEISVEMFDS